MRSAKLHRSLQQTLARVCWIRSSSPGQGCRKPEAEQASFVQLAGLIYSQGYKLGLDFPLSLRTNTTQLKVVQAIPSHITNPSLGP